MSQQPEDTIASANKELVNRARTGDQDAITQLFDIYRPSIEAYIRSFLRKEFVITNVIKRTFTHARKDLPNIGENEQIYEWLISLIEKDKNSYVQFDNASPLFSDEPKLSELPNQNPPLRKKPSSEMLEEPSILRIRIEEEPLTAQNVSIVISAITDLHTRCWLMQQNRFTDLIDYAQTRDPRFIKEANLQVGAMSHNSRAIVDLLLNAGTIAGGAATLVLVLTKAIDAIAQTPLRFQATKLTNLKEKQEQEIRGKQAELDQKVAAQKAETEDKGKHQEQQLEAERKLFELEKQRMLLEIEKQKFEVEAEKQRAALDRERLEFEKNRIIIVEEIAVTMVGQLFSSEDRQDAGRTEMLVHSLIPSLLQLSAIDAVVTTLPPEKPNEENKESGEEK